MEVQLEKKDAEEECEDKMQHEDERNRGRKMCKTLDAPLADIDRDDNLYVAVRQNLHKVNRVSQTSLFALKSSPEKTNRSGVSRESTIGRFATIKAFFDRNVGEEREGMRFKCRTTMMSRLMTMLGLRKGDLFLDELTSIGCSSC